MEVSASASKRRNNIVLKFLLLILLFFHFSSTITAIRKYVGFQIIHPCKTTVQGRYLLSDDNGYVCNATSVNSRSRCCPQRGEKFSCHGCNLLSQCCNSYEYCVSCCLNPAMISKEQAVKMNVAKPATAMFLTTVLGDAIIVLRAWSMKMLILVTSTTAFLCHQILLLGKIVLSQKQDRVASMLLLGSELLLRLLLLLRLTFAVSCYSIAVEPLITCLTGKVNHVIQFANQEDNHVSQINLWCLIILTLFTNI